MFTYKLPCLQCKPTYIHYTVKPSHLTEPHFSRPRCYAKSPTVHDTFGPIPGLISCAGVTGRWGLLSHTVPYVQVTHVITLHSEWCFMTLACMLHSFPCFKTGRMKPSGYQRLQHKTWPTSRLSTHPSADTAHSPCGVAPLFQWRHLLVVWQVLEQFGCIATQWSGNRRVLFPVHSIILFVVTRIICSTIILYHIMYYIYVCSKPT